MTKNLLLSALIWLLASVCTAVESTEPRVWRTSDGKHSIRAEAIDAKYDSKSKTTLIYLKKSDGTTLTIPFNTLADQCRECAWYDVLLRRSKHRNRPFSLPLPGTVKFTEKRMSEVNTEDIPETLVKKDGNVLLGIAARDHALGRPPEGWCGEVAIQETMLYYGVYYPQDMINEAGKPVHPDLYSNEIPIALKNLSMEFQYWNNESANLGDFLDWLRKQIADGTPVLTGVKIYPTQHDEWGLDHFVLTVGVKEKSLVFNTTWGFRYTLSERQLRSTDKGFSFANKYNSYYGISIKGFHRREDAVRPVRLFVQKETADRLAVIVKCEGLEPGKEYSLYKLSSAKAANPKPSITFTAKRSVHAFHDTIERASPAIYRCDKPFK